MDTQDPFNFGEWVFQTAMISILLGFSFFLQACDNMKTMEETKIVPTTRTNSIPNIAIPPIDSSVPFKTETATFALG